MSVEAQESQYRAEDAYYARIDALAEVEASLPELQLDRAIVLMAESVARLDHEIQALKRTVRVLTERA
jgi:hypothetical protein